MIENAIKNAVIEDVPFPHAVLNNFFEKTYYQELLNAIDSDNTIPIHLPEEDCYPDKQHIIDIEDITKNFSFWDNFMQMMSSEEMLNELKEVWDLKYPINTIVYNIHKDKKGFYRGPHNDVKSWNREMVSIQVFCPANHDLSHTGTRLHEHKQIEFVPNRAWIFKSCDTSVHSVDVVEDDMPRNSILIKYMATMRKNE